MDYKDTYTWKEINETPSIFDRLRECNEETLKSLCEDIKRSGKTNFVATGRGASNNALIYFKYVLEVMSDYTVGFSAPSIITLYKGKANYSNSIVLGVSQSGKAQDVLEVIKRGNTDGAITVAITNNKDSEIAKNAKYHLYLNAGEQNSFVATKTLNAEMYMLLLFASVLVNKRENLVSLKYLKYDIENAIPEIDRLTDKYAEDLKNAKNGFILSRGLAYSVALSASLIMKETCYIPMEGFAGSEFYHGPLVMVNKDTPVIIYCAKNDFESELQSAIRADQIKLIERILELKASVFLVTNDIILTGKFKSVKEAHINVNIPEEFTVFAFNIFAQMLACKISCKLGYNPDEPRFIEKNVVTF